MKAISINGKPVEGYEGVVLVDKDVEELYINKMTRGVVSFVRRIGKKCKALYTKYLYEKGFLRSPREGQV